MHKCQPLSVSIPASPSFCQPPPSLPFFQLLCICFLTFNIHSFLHPYLHTYSLHCLHFSCSSTLLSATHYIMLTSPSTSYLSCILHRYCTFLHCIFLSLVLFHCLVSVLSLSRSLLGDPLVTSPLLQLPWFQGEGTVITVWINKHTWCCFIIHKKINKWKYRRGSRHSMELHFITESRYSLQV